MKKEIKCPVAACPRKFKRSARGRKDMQHHLYMGHSTEVVESHKLAALTMQKGGSWK